MKEKITKIGCLLSLATAIFIIFIYFIQSRLSHTPAWASTTETGSSKVITTEDVFIAENNPNSNQADAVILYLNNKPGVQRRALMRFVLSNVPTGAIVNSAKIQLYVSNGSRSNGSADAAGDLYSVNGSWNESSVTWNTAPQLGNLITKLEPNTSAVPGTWREADVTNIVKNNGTYDFYLIHNSPAYDDLSYTSSESTAETAGIAEGQPFLIVSWTTATTAEVTHGPIAGGVTDAQANIFVRTSEATSVRIAYDAINTYASSSAKLSSAVFTSETEDFTTIVPISDLTAETKYYYWIALGDREPDTTNTYEFTTFPHNDTLRDFSFALFADLTSHDDWTAASYLKAARYKPAFAGQIGDFRHDDPGMLPTPIAISNWWTQNKKAIRDSLAGNDFAENIGNSFPFFHIWDDHDYARNNANKNSAYKDLATTAFKQYFPTYPLHTSGLGFWQKIRYGKEAVVLVLDVRSQRYPNELADSSLKTMLGTTQKGWLKYELLSAQNEGVIWKFVVTPSVWNRNSKQDDSWYIFKYEQEELINYSKNKNIKNVIIIDSDLHSGGAADNGSGTISCSIGWCIPEFNIPHTNIFSQQDCTGTLGCGTWSEGVIMPKTGSVSNAGFGLVTVSQTSANFKAIRGSDRYINLQYTVNAR